MGWTIAWQARWTRIDRNTILGAGLLALACNPGAGLAQEKLWAPDSGNNWHVASNWDPAGVPTSSNDVRIDGPGGPVIDSNNAQGALLRVGVNTSASLIINNGRSLSTSQATLGQGSIGEGLLWLAGASSWSNSGVLSIGASGGDGHLIVGNGSSVGTTQTLVGVSSSAEGLIEVTGSGSTLNAGTLDLGVLGQGEMRISSGASGGSAASRIGAGAGSEGHARVTGWPTSWVVNGNLTVADHGSGHLEVLSGAVVHAHQNVVIGGNNGADGLIEVLGSSGTIPSRFNANQTLIVGHSGEAAWVVGSGAQIETEGFVIIGQEEGASGNSMSMMRDQAGLRMDSCPLDTLARAN